MESEAALKNITLFERQHSTLIQRRNGNEILVENVYI